MSGTICEAHAGLSQTVPGAYDTQHARQPAMVPTLPWYASPKVEA